MAENLIALLRKKCWDKSDVRRLLLQLSRYDADCGELLRILDEVAAFCLGEVDELPVLLPH